MHDPIVWIGGWASNLACWRSDLEQLYPNREHTFLDAHVILEEPGLLSLAAASIPTGGTLVAWSLGSLLLHQSLAAGLFRPECQVLSICPIFDFCRVGGPWPLATLSRMIRRLPKSREAVMAEFFGQVTKGSTITSKQAEAWKQQAMGYSKESLIAGLAALGNIRLDYSNLSITNRHTFLASVQDPLSPLARENISEPNWMLFPKGHVPFLDYPELLYPLLARHSPGTRI